MQTNNSLARLISIIFALSVVSGAWLLFEYSQHLPAKQKQAEQPLQPPKLDRERPPIVQPGSVEKGSSNMAVTYQCKGKMGIVFRDHPCLPDEREIKVVASEAARSSPNEIANLKAKADAMEQTRLASTQQFHVAQNTQAQTQNKRAACDDVDRQVAQIDSELRMPNYPARIDYLKDERKKLMDFRFSSGC